MSRNTRQFLIMMGCLGAIAYATIAVVLISVDADTRAVWLLIGVSTVSLILIALIAVCYTWLWLRAPRRAMRELSLRRGGRMIPTITGEPVVRLPVVNGEITIDLQTTAERYAQVQFLQPTRWTRLTIQDSMPSSTRVQVCSSDPRGLLPVLGEQLVVVSPTRWRFRMKPSSQGTVAELWIDGWYCHCDDLDDAVHSLAAPLRQAMQELRS